MVSTGFTGPDDLVDPVFHWFLPTRGDADTPGVIPAFGDTRVRTGRRESTLDYLVEVARAAEDSGFHSALTHRFRKRGLVDHGSQHDWTDQVTINVGHRERTHGAFDSAAWFCRRHVDLRRVAGARCSVC